MRIIFLSSFRLVLLKQHESPIYIYIYSCLCLCNNLHVGMCGRVRRNNLKLESFMRPKSSSESTWRPWPILPLACIMLPDPLPLSGNALVSVLRHTLATIQLARLSLLWYLEGKVSSSKQISEFASSSIELIRRYTDVETLSTRNRNLQSREKEKEKELESRASKLIEPRMSS